jgi:phosphatidate cytidylyltransferase
MRNRYNQLYERLITGFSLSMGALCMFYAPPLVFYMVCIACSFFIIRHELPQLAHSSLQYITLALFYIGIPFALSMHLYSNPAYRILFVVLIVLTISNDIGAYVAGSVWGTHRIAPAISPKKSWEGFFGGCIAVFCSLCIISYSCLPHAVSYLFLVGVSVGVATVATLGDFFESWLKRRAGVKDSGTLLPGHGGLLDRFDSLIFVISIGYFCKDYLVRIFCA